MRGNNIDRSVAALKHGTTSITRARSCQAGAEEKPEPRRGHRGVGTLKGGGAELERFYAQESADAQESATEGAAVDRGDAASPRDSSCSSSSSIRRHRSSWEVRDKGNSKQRRGRGVRLQQVGETVAGEGAGRRRKAQRYGRPFAPSSFGSERAAAGIGCSWHGSVHPCPQLQHLAAHRQQGAHFLACGGATGVRRGGTGVVLSGSRGDGAEPPASAAVPPREPSDRGKGRGVDRHTEEQRASKGTVDAAIFEERAGEEEAPPLAPGTAAVGAELGAVARAGGERGRHQHARQNLGGNAEATTVAFSPELRQHQTARPDTATTSKTPGGHGKGDVGSFGLESTPGDGGDLAEEESVGPVAESYERGRWLLGLLVLQSTSSSVLDKYQVRV